MRTETSMTNKNGPEKQHLHKTVRCVDVILLYRVCPSVGGQVSPVYLTDIGTGKNMTSKCQPARS